MGDGSRLQYPWRSGAQSIRSDEGAVPGIEWRRIIGLRNFVVRGYDAVDYSRHWVVIQDDLPRLIVELEKANS